MAIGTLAIFGREVPGTETVFPLMMFLGFATFDPLNRYMLERGIKEEV